MVARPTMRQAGGPRPGPVMTPCPSHLAVRASTPDVSCVSQSRRGPSVVSHRNHVRSALPVSGRPLPRRSCVRAPEHLPEAAVRRTPRAECRRGHGSGIHIDEDGAVGVRRDRQLQREVVPGAFRRLSDRPAGAEVDVRCRVPRTPGPSPGQSATTASGHTRARGRAGAGAAWARSARRSGDVGCPWRGARGRVAG